MGADNIIIVKPEELTVKAEQLKNDTAEPMDYLRDIVGMDWTGEKKDWEHCITWNVLPQVIALYLKP